MRRYPLFALIRSWVLILLLCIWSGLPVVQTAAAQSHEPRQTTLDETRQRVDTLKRELQQKPDDERLQTLRLQALQSYRQASDANQALQPMLANVQARQRELGDETANPDDTLADERRQLDDEAAELAAQVRLASLTALDASHALENIAAQRREHFNARLGARSTGLLSAAFWSDLSSTTPLDTMRSRSLLVDTGRMLAGLTAWQWLLAGSWVVTLLGTGVLLRRRLWHYSATQVPPGRLRRAVHAWTRVLLAVAVPTLLLEGLRLGLSWVSPLTLPAQAFIGGLIATVGFCGYIIGLGQGLLSPRQASWRLLSLRDDTALALRHLPTYAALFIGITWLAENLATLASVRLAIIILIHSVAGLALILLLAGVVKQLATLRRDENATTADAPWLTRLLRRRHGQLLGLAWTALAFSLICLLTGYVALASFILKQILWSSVLLASALLLSITATELTRQASRASLATAEPASAWRVLLGGVAQMMIALFTLLLLFAPYGQGPMDVYEQIERLRGSLSIGDIQLRPTAILQGILWLILGLGAVKAARHWLTQHLLPATKMDTGMQASTSTLAGYLGYVIVVATALSAAGVGLERITWIASALSVGIGFGLQAIVQNFVSGIILLTERPVKVGDWVSLSGIEGDIRRINVRATEIQMSDRSRIVVPNSEFITKIVRNVTPLNALGRLQIKLPLPVDSDAGQVRELLLTALQADGAVLSSPTPEVYLDEISNSALLFNAVAYVSSPRLSYATRSRVLFDILRRLREAGIPVCAPTTMLLADKPRIS